MKQVFYSQFIDAEAETKWLPKLFGTELRIVSGDNDEEGVAGPLSRQPPILPTT